MYSNPDPPILGSRLHSRNRVQNRRQVVNLSLSNPLVAQESLGYQKSVWEVDDHQDCAGFMGYQQSAEEADVQHVCIGLMGFLLSAYEADDPHVCI